MEPPSYVPQSVLKRLCAVLDGKDGLAAALERAEAEVLYLERQASSDDLRIQLLEARNHRRHLARDVGCARRLIDDERMRPAYALLVQELGDGDHVAGFIRAAWAALMDYSPYREGVRAANELADQVAKAAGVLATLLRKAERSSGPYLPDEFFNVTSLLRRTDHDRDDRNFHMWRGLRRHILGDMVPAGEEQGLPKATEHTSAEKIEIVFVPMEAARRDPDAEQRDDRRYAWSTAPTMAKLIATMEAAAKSYVAAESGHIAAAIASRKRNVKAEYVRAFANLLPDSAPITPKPAIINAMAITATVALDDPDDVVTAADVRSALARPAA